MKNGIGKHCQTILKIIIKHIFGGKAKSILTFLPPGHVRFLTFVETTGLEGAAPGERGGRDAGGSTSDEYSKQG